MGAYSPVCSHWQDDSTLKRYGAIASISHTLPLGVAAMLPFVSRAQLQQDMASLSRTVGFVVFSRDSGSGTVTLGPQVCLDSFACRADSSPSAQLSSSVCLCSVSWKRMHAQFFSCHIMRRHSARVCW